MSKGGNNKDLIKYYPADEKPCTDYTSLRDACFDDFTSGEGYHRQPYIDCLGHLTIGVGTLLYHKSSGFSGAPGVDGKSRLEMCGYNEKQRNALVTATKLLNPKECMNLSGNECHTYEKIDPDSKKKYFIKVQRIPGAGTKILSVRKEGESEVSIPPIGHDQYRKVFNGLFKSYYDGAINTIGSQTLHSLPRSQQCLCVHQVYARGSFPEGRNITSIETAQRACADSIAYRKANWGVSEGEEKQLAHCQKVVTETRTNERQRKVVDHRNTATQNRQWAEKNQSKMERKVDQRQSQKQSARGSAANRRSGGGGKSSYRGGGGSYSGVRGGGCR